MQAITPEQFLTQMRWRYAVKRFDPSKKIPAPLWEAIEESLLLTPSSYGLQPWKFIVAQSSDLRAKLRPASWNQSQVEDCSHYVIFSTLRTITEEYIDKFILRMAELQKTDVSKLSGFRSMLINDAIKGPCSAWVKEWCARQAYIALGNAMTTAAALGVDACPMEGFENTKYEEILGLQDSPYQVIVCCAFGYRHAEDRFSKIGKVRFPKKDIFDYR